MSLNRRELDGFKGQMFKFQNSFTFPHFLTSQTRNHTIFPYILVFLQIIIIVVCS